MREELETVIAHFTHRTGLALTGRQREELGAYVERRFNDLGCAGAADYIGQLGRPEEFRGLVGCITVAETYFWREARQFEVLRQELLPGLLSLARAEGRKLRFWSAGCCTGEEPYALALIAAESGIQDEVEILGTDINEAYLERAVAGVYSRRSVEKLPPELLRRYFTPDGGAFRLAPEIRGRVRFELLNLGEPHYPSFLNGTAGVDAIFCRNVLIYFDKQRLAEVLERFKRCLSPGGVLAFGHSEMFPPEWGLTPRNIEGAFFYSEPALPPAGAEPPVYIPRPRAAATAPAGPAELPPAAPAPAAADPGALLAAAERLADAGRAKEAAELCRKAARLKPTLERAHYLLGVLELDRPEAARDHFRKVVYLDPANVLARWHMALLDQKLGRRGDALREFRNLERLAAGRPAEQLIDEKEGLTYGLLALLSRQAAAGLVAQT